MYHTTNDTTTQTGTATATVICDSVSPAGQRLTTLELVYPRFIHSEFMTHRMFSRNAASSRATPTRTLLKEVEDDPVMPTVWRKNRPGMSGGEEFSEGYHDTFERAWKNAARNARITASRLAELGLAKESVNRLIEPFVRIRTLVTATEWFNFFKLRLDEAHVQPEMFELASAMEEAMEKSDPVERRYHVPYVEKVHLINVESQTPSRDDMMVSAARCARVSYLSHDGKQTTALADLHLADKLLRDGHMSPFEHAATALNDSQVMKYNLRGWVSLRYAFEKGGTR